MLKRYGGIFDIEAKLTRITVETEKTLDPGFWNDAKAAEKHLRQISSIKQWTEAFAKVQSAVEDLKVIFEFFNEGEAAADDVETQ